jgi:hypothetical protein
MSSVEHSTSKNIFLVTLYALSGFHSIPFGTESDPWALVLLSTAAEYAEDGAR